MDGWIHAHFLKRLWTWTIFQNVHYDEKVICVGYRKFMEKQFSLQKPHQNPDGYLLDSRCRGSFDHFDMEALDIVSNWLNEPGNMRQSEGCFLRQVQRHEPRWLSWPLYLCLQICDFFGFWFVRASNRRRLKQMLQPMPRPISVSSSFFQTSICHFILNLYL